MDDRAGKRARTTRCGNCNGCVRGDCGECKNCLDKPKFGGRGIKKQACLQRVCCNPQEEEADSLEDEEADPSPPLRPAKAPMAGEVAPGFCSTETTPKLTVMIDCARAIADSATPPPLELPEPSPVCKRSSRGLHSKKVSFADESSTVVGEPVAYSTDDEEEQTRQERQIWGAALANRAALVSQCATPTLPPLAAPDRPLVPSPAVLAAPASVVGGSALERLTEACRPNAEHAPQRDVQGGHSEREAGAAEALVMAGCESPGQLPLLLLLSASAR